MHLRFGGGEFPVAQQPGPVGGGVHRVVRLVAALREPGELLDDDGRVIGIPAFRMEMPELQDAGPRRVGVGVVHHRAALEIADRQHLLVEVQRPPAQRAGRVVEVPVHRPGVDDRQRAPGGGQAQRAICEEVGVESDLDPRMVGHPLQPGAVPVDRQTFVGVGEVAVVVGVADRQPGDHRRRQLARVGLPLLGGVVADEGLVQRSADRGDRLVLQRLFGPALALARLGGRLLGDQCPGLRRGQRGAEELVDGAQVDRQREHLAAVGREHPVLVAGEGGEAVDVLPDPLVGGVEQVRPVPVHLDAGAGFRGAPGVAADVRPPVDHDDAQTQFGGAPLGDRQSEESGPDDQHVGH